MLPQKILVVDDERNVTDVVSMALQLEGYRHIEWAANGREGLEKYKRFLPDLVLMDINMPVMDGYESSCRIKSFDPGARILALTGDPTDSRARKTIEEGIALTLLVKPVSLEDLRQTVRENLPSDT
jgi:CheY-like chemotaxis protein